MKGDPTLSRPPVQNFILVFGVIAFVAGAVHVLVPHSAEEVAIESLEACGQ